MERDKLQTLFRLSRSNNRGVWWPATVQLGKLASVQGALRNDIWTSTCINSLGMKFVEVGPGRFIQGPDVHRVFSLAVAHPVEISKGYFIAVTEVTNTQFQEVLPSFRPDSQYSPYPDSPAVNVSWEDANQFCILLSEREGATYRLPTEAEWEYACRAGTTTLFSFGDDSSRLEDYGWYDYSHQRASRVAMLIPNRWGIYDMHGNAVEWVSDWFDSFYRKNTNDVIMSVPSRQLDDVFERFSDWLGTDSYYLKCRREGIVRDPKGPAQGITHVLRGGGWPARIALACSSTTRMPLPILNRPPFSADEAGVRQAMGFRVVRELDVGGE